MAPDPGAAGAPCETVKTSIEKSGPSPRQGKSEASSSKAERSVM